MSTTDSEDIASTADGVSADYQRAPHAAYVTRMEPPEQGGEIYRRCRSCGVEALASFDWSRVRHREHCGYLEGN